MEQVPMHKDQKQGEKWVIAMEQNPEMQINLYEEVSVLDEDPVLGAAQVDEVGEEADDNNWRLGVDKTVNLIKINPYF